VLYRLMDGVVDSYLPLLDEIQVRIDSLQGRVPGSAYESARIDLQAGDVLVLFTDGVVEAQNPKGEEYSVQRLASIVSSHPQRTPSELIQTIHASVIKFRGTTALADDFTLLVLKIL
jgi:serine phosphatase RsbU (regulator of sigma subunit)